MDKISLGKQVNQFWSFKNGAFLNVMVQRLQFLKAAVFNISLSNIVSLCDSSDMQGLCQ